MQKYQISNIKYQISTIIALLLISLPLFADVKRESLHFVSTELGVGYSALLNKSTLGPSSGLAGGALQLGYEWRYRHLFLHSGVEFASVNNRASVEPFLLKTAYTVGLPEGQYMTEYFDFQSYHETQLVGQVNIPVQIGAIFSDRYYFLAGARLGLPVLHNAVAQAKVHTWLEDPYLIGELENVPIHDSYTSDEKISYSWPANILNAQISAEVGVVLNSFINQPAAPKGRGKASGKGRGRNTSTMNGRSGSKGGKGGKKPILYRVALFADYGITSCAVSSLETKSIASVSQPRNIELNGFFDASHVPANSLLVGAKFAVLFQLNEIKPPAKPKPSYFDIFITDAKTNEYIPASLSLYEHASNKTTVKEAKNGKVHYRAKDGDYTFTASNEQYFPSSKEATMAGDGVTEEVRLALQPVPVPVVIDTPIINIPIKVGAKVVLHNIFFETNKVQILPESEEALNELAAFMNLHPSVSVRITGHTDAIGSDRDNQILSEGRANAVRDELLKRGIAAERIEANGKGESEPIADNATEEGRAKNRRVEFVIISTGDEDIEQVRE